MRGLPILLRPFHSHPYFMSSSHSSHLQYSLPTKHHSLQTQDTSSLEICRPLFLLHPHRSFSSRRCLSTLFHLYDFRPDLFNLSSAAPLTLRPSTSISHCSLLHDQATLRHFFRLLQILLILLIVLSTVHLLLLFPRPRYVSKITPLQ